MMQVNQGGTIVLDVDEDVHICITSLWQDHSEVRWASEETKRGFSITETEECVIINACNTPLSRNLKRQIHLFVPEIINIHVKAKILSMVTHNKVYCLFPSALYFLYLRFVSPNCSVTR